MDVLIFERPKFCKTCNSDVTARLVKSVTSNGTHQYYWWCMTGSHQLKHDGNHFISPKKLIDYGIDFSRLPVIDKFGGSNPCVICGDPYTEYHHFAPRHLFEDAHLWPGAYLCKFHHKLWHDIVTPNMSKQDKKNGNDIQNRGIPLLSRP